MPFACNFCDITYARKWNRDRHHDRVHGFTGTVLPCSFCPDRFSSYAALREHTLKHAPRTRFEVVHSAFRKTCVLYRLIPKKKMTSVGLLFKNINEDIVSLLSYEIGVKSNLKLSIILHILFEKESPTTGELEKLEHCIRPPNRELSSVDNISPFIRAVKLSIENRVLCYTEAGSGWTVQEIMAVDIDLGRCASLNGACGQLSISKLYDVRFLRPHDWMGDSGCFLKSVALFFVGQEKTSLLESFIKANINWPHQGPVKASDISKFEEANAKLDLKINLLYTDGKEVYPLHRSSRLAKNAIVLLLYVFKYKNELIGHYIFVDDLTKFLRRTYRNDNRQLTYKKGERCENCLSEIPNTSSLTAHQELCFAQKPEKIVMPKFPNNKLEFWKRFNTTPVPIIGFFDFEATTIKADWACSSCKSNSCHHKTLSPYGQEAICYSLLIVNRYKSVLHFKTYSGTDAAQNLVSELCDIENDLLMYIRQHLPMHMTVEDEETFIDSENCYICEGELLSDKVRDHCHMTGIFLGAAHSECNLNRKESKRIPIYCHNMAGYDSHFIIRALGNEPRIVTSSALPSNGQKLKTFSLNSFHFLDTLAFLQTSLSSLVQDLPQTHNYSILDQSNLYSRSQPHIKALLLKKGIYCYEWATSYSKLKHARSLPPHAAFFSKLTNSNISAEDYNHAKTVYECLKCKNMLEYTEYYCCLDTYLLAEVFFAFQEEIKMETNLDCW